jgi:putative N-acetylmannosamine-6-phosphate epimerase
MWGVGTTLSGYTTTARSTDCDAGAARTKCSTWTIAVIEKLAVIETIV